VRTIRMFLVYAVITTLVGCAITNIKPNYTSTNLELSLIGGDKPGDKEPEIISMGSYCLKVVEKWKADGETPDNQKIWTKDTVRKAIPCQ